jgi:hypothetical protein
MFLIGSPGWETTIYGKRQLKAPQVFFKAASPFPGNKHALFVDFWLFIVVKVQFQYTRSPRPTRF